VEQKWRTKKAEIVSMNRKKKRRMRNLKYKGSEKWRDRKTTKELSSDASFLFHVEFLNSPEPPSPSPLSYKSETRAFKFHTRSLNYFTYFGRIKIMVLFQVLLFLFVTGKRNAREREL